MGMKHHIVVTATVLLLMAGPVLAASPDVESAIKSLGQLEADPARLQSYCKIIIDMDAAGDNEAKFDALEKQLMDLLRSFGPQFEQVIAVSEDTPSDSPDGQALEAAFRQLDEKCSR
jgi:hypothetical protein